MPFEDLQGHIHEYANNHVFLRSKAYPRFRSFQISGLTLIQDHLFPQHVRDVFHLQVDLNFVRHSDVTIIKPL